MFKAFALLHSADNSVENAWRERNWLNFIYFCLVTTAAIMVVGFLLCMVGGAIFLEGSRIYWLIRSAINPAVGTGNLAGISANYFHLFYFALNFSAIIGFFSLISAAPAMLVKGIYEPISNLLFSFEGRIDRMTWLITAVVTAGVMLALALAIYLLGGVIGENAHPVLRAFLDLLWLILVVLVVPAIWVGLAIAVKRLHDRNKPYWWLFIFYGLPLALYVAGLAKDLAGFSLPLTVAAIAIGIWSLAEMAGLRGTVGPNEHGPDPLDGSA